MDSAVAVVYLEPVNISSLKKKKKRLKSKIEGAERAGPRQEVLHCCQLAALEFKI